MSFNSLTFLPCFLYLFVPVHLPAKLTIETPFPPSYLFVSVYLSALFTAKQPHPLTKMSTWWADCSSKFQIHKILETKMVDARSYKYGGELSNRKPSTRNKILKSTDELGQPLLPHGEEGLKHAHGYDYRGRDEKKGVNIRVKVLMTKEEAAKLLSKCKDQKGTIELRDAVRELLTIPSNRVHVISAASNNRDMVLHSIPEEE